MIDVGFVHFERSFGIALQAETRESGIARVECIARRDGIDGRGEKIERAATESIGGALTEVPVAGQPFAIAYFLEQRVLLLAPHAWEHVSPRCIEFDQLCLLVGRQWKVGDERSSWARIHAGRWNIVGHHAHRVAGDQHVRAERFAGEEYCS